MRVTLVYNPGAGADEQLSGEALVDLIGRAGHSIVRYSSTSDDWDDALTAPADIVAVAGGDGTVGKLAKKLIDHPVPIAVLPMGTANNIAATLGLIARPIEEVIAEWTSARHVKFDVGEVIGPWGSKYFIEGVGMGIFADTMARFHSKDNVDISHLDDTQIKITSVLHILKDRLRHYPAKKLVMTLDGQDASGEYILVEALNIKFIGPNLQLAAEADPGDGFLNVALISVAEETQFSSYLSDAMANKLPNFDWPVRKAKQIVMRWDGFAVHIDDEDWPGKDSSAPPSPARIELTATDRTLDFLAPG